MSTSRDRSRTKGGLQTITLGQLLAHQFPAREPLVAPWLRQGESAMIWAAPGTGKTLLTLTLAILVAGGGSVLGWRADKPRKVLLVDGEMSIEDLQERATWLIDTVKGIDREAAERNLQLLSRSWQAAEVDFPDLGERVPARTGRKAGQDVAFERAMACGAELVMLDNFSTLVEVADENDAGAMNSTLAFLLRLKQARIGCVLVHHSGKSGETYRGSSKLATTFEVILGLRPLEGAMATDGAAFRLDWTKYRREPCEAVRSRVVRLGKDEAGSPEWQAEPTMDDDTRVLLAELETAQHGTQRELAAALGWHTTKVSRTKMAAIKAGATTAAQFDQWMAEARQAQEPGAALDF